MIHCWLYCHSPKEFQSRAKVPKQSKKQVLLQRDKILNYMREQMDTERDEPMEGQGNKNAKLWI